jgi:reversibly glycosylated polypeptide
MRVGLITTTINLPTVLRLYRKLDESVIFFITGDKKTPHEKVKQLVSELGNAHYYSDAEQQALGHKSSDIIGWNKIVLRNIALLEAIRHKCDVIITVDDDNIPISKNYFEVFKNLFSRDFSGLRVESETGWFDAGQLLEPKVHHRGFPYAYRNKDLRLRMHPCVSARIGVAAGLWLGDPDIDAVTRIALSPQVLRISDLLTEGLVVARGCFTPFNSQNTAYRGELAPLMMMQLGVGRYDDIWGSYVAQRILSETDFHVYFGPPFVWQERNQQNIWQNLRDELYGMEMTERFVEALLEVDIGKGSIIEKLSRIYRHLESQAFIPQELPKLGFAWCDDVARVM